jgi:hypothetical protein
MNGRSVGAVHRVVRVTVPSAAGWADTTSMSAAQVNLPLRSNLVESLRVPSGPTE